MKFNFSHQFAVMLMMFGLFGCTLAIRTVGNSLIVIAPILNQPLSQIFSLSTEVLQGSPITAIDFSNTLTSSDSGITYQCSFDRVVDSLVLSGTDCSNLPGAPVFNTGTGEFAWTPDSTAFGAYEIQVTGANTAGSDSKILVIDVKQNFETSNLLGYWDAGFARSNGGQGNNTSLHLIDLSGNANHAVFNNFGSTPSSGFAGALPDTAAGETADPYRLVFDGINDSISLGIGYNAQASFYFESWVKPESITTANSIILANADTGAGFKLSQNFSADGQLQLVVGSTKSYADEVLADSPVGYWKLDEAAGSVAKDSGSNAIDAAYTNTPTLGSSSAIKDNGNAMTGTGAGIGCALVPANNAIDIASTLTIELWVKYTAIEEKYWIHKGNDYFDLLTYTADNGKITFYISTIGGLKTTNPFNDGNWHYVVATYDQGGGANNMNIYVDNVLEGTSTSAAFINTAHTAMGIGSNFLGSSGGTTATLDEVAIYNSVLSPARRTAHYSASTRPTCRSNTLLANGTWNQIGALFTGGNTLKLFIDGVQECSVTAAATYAGSSQQLKTGAFEGAIGDLRLYSTGSAVTNTNNFNNTKQRFQ